MDHFIGVWWAGGEDDARPAGAGGQGLSRRSTSTLSAPNYPAIKDIQKYVVDKGKSQIPSKDKVGETLYNRGVMNSVLIAEAIRNAQQLTGKKASQPAKTCAAVWRRSTSPRRAGRSSGSTASPRRSI